MEVEPEKLAEMGVFFIVNQRLKMQERSHVHGIKYLPN
jgi:hypothetical protein